MVDLASIGRLLVGTGLVLLVIGAVLWLGGQSGWLQWLGRLPGDFVFRRGESTVFIPLATSLLLSILLSVVLTVLLRR